MRSSIALALLPILAGVPRLARAADDLAPVLARAAAVEDATKPVYDTWSYTLSVDSKEIDKKGKTKTEEIVDLRHHENGQEELLRDVKDGKDITAERKKEEQAHAHATPSPSATATAAGAKKDDDGGNLGFESPFAREKQPLYRFERAGGGAPEPGVLRIRFAPKDAKRKGAMAGEAEVEDATGRVRSMTMHPAKLPTLVSQLDVTMVLGTSLATGPVLSKIVVDATGGILFVKKRFHVVTTFSDWTQPSPPLPTAAPSRNPDVRP